MNTKQYLGDSVYVDINGYHFVLTTEYGGGTVVNRFILSLVVFAALKNYVDRLKEPQPQDPL